MHTGLRWQGAAVGHGCSTAGEFTGSACGDGGISAIALRACAIARSAAAIADLGEDPTGAICYAVGDRISHRGVALVACWPTGPSVARKTCTFAPTGRSLRVAKADVPVAGVQPRGQTRPGPVDQTLIGVVCTWSPTRR